MASLLDQLKPERRIAFVLYYLEELELAEVAARLKVSAETARARARRGRADLIAAVERFERRHARERAGKP